MAAFLGPLNASRTNELLAGLPDAGPYAVLAVVGALLHTGLRIPNDEEARTGEQCPMREIRANPAFGVALWPRPWATRS